MVLVWGRRMGRRCAGEGRSVEASGSECGRGGEGLRASVSAWPQRARGVGEVQGSVGGY